MQDSLLLLTRCPHTLILSAGRILLLANGEAKAQALYDSFFGPVTPRVPASILQLHKNVTVIADEAALSLIHAKGLLTD